MMQSLHLSAEDLAKISMNHDWTIAISWDQSSAAAKAYAAKQRAHMVESSAETCPGLPSCSGFC